MCRLRYFCVLGFWAVSYTHLDVYKRQRFHIVDALTDETLSKLYVDCNAADVLNDVRFAQMIKDV